MTINIPHSSMYEVNVKGVENIIFSDPQSGIKNTPISIPIRKDKVAIDWLMYENRSPILEMLNKKGIAEKVNRSYWYCFISSLDRKQDVNIIKELLFWENLYHRDDSNVTILIPGWGWSGNQYDYYRRVFQINEVPCLVITDNKFPTDFIIMSKNLINTKYLGDNFVNIRDILDTFHNMIMNEGNLQKIKRTLIKEKLTKIIGKTWKELSKLVSINIGK